MKENFSRVVWGFVLVILGVVWGLNATGVANINIFFDGWWTLFIIIPCFIGLIDPKNSDKSGNAIGLLVGIVLLLASRDYISFDLVWKLLLPIVVVVIGLSMIFENTIKSKISQKIKEASKNSLDGIVATFSEQVVNKNNEAFEGANLDSVFGSIILDLTKAKLKEETVIKASAIFGGIDIIVPNDVEVKVKATSIFGGVSNKALNKDGKKVIYIDALCLFGGIDIK